MMTHDEIIEIVKAHKEGKQIQYLGKKSRGVLGDYIENLKLYEFMKEIYDSMLDGSSIRIKPEPQYRPYETPDEVPVGRVVKDDKGSRYVILKALMPINFINTLQIMVGEKIYAADYFMETFRLEDGSPCGIPIKEPNN